MCGGEFFPFRSLQYERTSITLLLSPTDTVLQLYLANWLPQLYLQFYKIKSDVRVLAQEWEGGLLLLD